MRTRVAVLISGRGSNLKSLLQAATDPTYPADISLVISNKPNVGGLDIAQQFNIPAQVIDHKNFPDKPSFEAELHEALVSAKIEYICLAGFMRILSADFIAKWPGKILNIHPSLLPDFPGLHTHERALAAGVKETGCTVHIVVPEVDGGPILGQARVPILPDDTPETLSQRVLEQEHKLYPLCLAKLTAGKP